MKQIKIPQPTSKQTIVVKSIRAKRNMSLHTKYLLLCAILASASSQYLNTNNEQGYLQLYPQPEAAPYGIPYNGYGNQQQPYYLQQPYPYPYIQYGTQNVPVASASPSTPRTKKPDPFANVKTEFIDIDPALFRRLMYQENFQPKIVSYEKQIRPVAAGTVIQPSYIIKSESKQFNKTTVPASISKHVVNSKTTKFKKTFVIHPNENKNNVLNLNFVNGVQVTDAPDGVQVTDAPEVVEVSKEARVATTLTTAMPPKVQKKFMDVPEGCEEGMGFAATGGCFDPFQLTLNKHKSNATSNTTTTKDHVPLKNKHGRHHY